MFDTINKLFIVCRMSIINKISEKVGGQANIAKHLGVSNMTVSQWKTRGVPAERVLDLEKLSGVPCWEIRPDLYEKSRFKKHNPCLLII